MGHFLGGWDRFFFLGIDCLRTFLTFFVKLQIPRNQKCQVVELGVEELST